MLSLAATVAAEEAKDKVWRATPSGGNITYHFTVMFFLLSRVYF
jgi:hypothetical protein